MESRAVADAVENGCSCLERAIAKWQKQLVAMRIDGRVPLHFARFKLFKVILGQPTSAAASMTESRPGRAKRLRRTLASSACYKYEPPHNCCGTNLDDFVKPSCDECAARRLALFTKQFASWSIIDIVLVEPDLAENEIR